ncbi:hypothetical protein ACLOJK_009547 [Asimina triloba]
MSSPDLAAVSGSTGSGDGFEMSFFHGCVEFGNFRFSIARIEEDDVAMSLLCYPSMLLPLLLAGEDKDALPLVELRSEMGYDRDGSGVVSSSPTCWTAQIRCQEHRR